MKKDIGPTDAEMRARALSRWEGKSGALAPTVACDSIVARTSQRMLTTTKVGRASVVSPDAARSMLQSPPY